MDQESASFSIIEINVKLAFFNSFELVTTSRKENHVGTLITKSTGEFLICQFRKKK